MWTVSSNRPSLYADRPSDYAGRQVGELRCACFPTCRYSPGQVEEAMIGQVKKMSSDRLIGRLEAKKVNKENKVSQASYSNPNVWEMSEAYFFLLLSFSAYNII